MRKLQNTVSTLGNENVRQGNSLVVRVEALRSLCASYLSALSTSALELAIELCYRAWQGLYQTWQKQPVDTVNCFVTAVFEKPVTKQDQRRHPMIMCHRAAA